MKNKNLQAIESYLSRELDPAFARRARLIAENLNITGKEQILEIGCGRGFYEQFLGTIYPKVKLTGVDLKESYLNIARHTVKSKNVTFLNADATQLPFKANTFDRIIATEVLEHIPNDLGVLSELYRVVKPGGIVMITVPNKQYSALWDPLNYLLEKLFHVHVPSNIWWLAGIWADHVRLYDEPELMTKIKGARFQIKKIWRSTHYCVPFSHFLLYGIGKNIVERGFFPSMNRFESDQPPSPLIKLVHSFIYSQDGKNNDSEKVGINTMNLVLKARKKM
jgi:ubiquinone/menaquinone biosynthesis C-methylase UbiE